MCQETGTPCWLSGQGRRWRGWGAGEGLAPLIHRRSGETDGAGSDRLQERGRAGRERERLKERGEAHRDGAD